MLAVGELVPEATVWAGTNLPVSLRQMIAGQKALLLFYLFDWSST